MATAKLTSTARTTRQCVLCGSSSACHDPVIAVVIPAYNEAAHILQVLCDLPPWADKVIVVDDASTDSTYDLVSPMVDHRLSVIRHEKNTGVGGAMITGYQAALESGADIVVKMDADGQMRSEEAMRLVRPLLTGMAEYAKGNRFYFRGATGRMPLARGYGNVLLTFLTKAASGYWHVFDSQCGFTAISSRYLRLLDIDSLAKDYFFENDMLIRLNEVGARVVDVPVTTVYGTEKSHVRVHRVILSFPPRMIIRAGLRFWRKHMLTDFGIVAVLTVLGIPLLCFGLMFGGYHWWLSAAHGTPATAGTVMLAVLPIILGVQLLLQALSLNVVGSLGSDETRAYIRDLVSEGEFE